MTSAASATASESTRWHDIQVMFVAFVEERLADFSSET